MSGRASDHLSFPAAFDFGRDLAKPGHREAMRAAGHTSGMRSIICNPREPIGEALRRVERIEGDGPVFLAVQDGEDWVMLTVPRPVRTEERT